MKLPVYEAPPFPALVWTDEGWEGDVFLAAYGTMTVIVVAADPSVSPTAAQACAFSRLVGQNEAVDDEVMRAILAEYPTYRERYQEFDPENAAQIVPPVSSADDLERLIDLDAVRVLEDEKDGEAYVGFQFSCTWDSEHNLGVMTHAGRVIEVGGVDTAFNPPVEAWKAARAAHRRPPVRQPMTPTPRTAPSAPHRWWEFWRRG